MTKRERGDLIMGLRECARLCIFGHHDFLAIMVLAEIKPRKSAIAAPPCDRNYSLFERLFFCFVNGRNRARNWIFNRSRHWVLPVDRNAIACPQFRTSDRSDKPAVSRLCRLRLHKVLATNHWRR
jgi:hypothetical protein